MNNIFFFKICPDAQKNIQLYLKVEIKIGVPCVYVFCLNKAV